MNTDDYVHTPVLLEEVLNGLDLRPEGVYVDCTFGRGGHSGAILQRLGAAGELYAFDRDPEAIRKARELAAADPRLKVFQAPFSQLADRLADAGRMGRVDGILLDLGVSSPQLEDASRGFSFLHEGALDMRMDPGSGLSAADWLNHAEQDEIARVLWEYGEERFSRRIARALVYARTERPLETTSDLARIVSAAIPSRERGKHPATRSFQAVRIYINRELEELSSVLVQACEALRAGGRLLVISFHSLEDRIVKRFMREYARSDPYPKDLPIRADMLKPRLKIVGKAVRAGEAETAANPRARSATLRIAEKPAS